jgi:putative oxidoreductase
MIENAVAPFLPALRFAGKLLVALLFWWDSIFLFIPGFQGTVQYIEQKGVPLPGVVAVITTIFLLVAPALLLLRKTELLGFLSLAIFCLMTAFIFHDFWALDPAERVPEQIHFMKDVALAGAMLALASSSAQSSLHAKP